VSDAGLASLLDRTSTALEQLMRERDAGLDTAEIGVVTQHGNGVARVRGLPGVRSEELILFPGHALGMAFDLNQEDVGVLLLEDARDLRAGNEARRTGRVLDAPAGEALLGRVISPTGQPLDDRGPLRATGRRPIEREAPPIMARAPVNAPLQTGVKSIDALIPIGRGQRELILGDRQTGKSAIAVDAILNQRDTGVLCVYCAIGQRSSAVARVIGALRERGAMAHTLVVVAGAEEPPGLQYVAPYAATAIAEAFMEQGRDVLIVYDDLTRHAWAYRELSLLLRRPPGREAYPGDIFYIHSRLLERATRLRAGGSLTALPIAETEAQNVSAYIPTNLISITDGQVYLSPELFQRGVLPAVDVGKSVSRVGGKAQQSAFRAVAGDLRLSYSQFEELESFARFGTRLDEETRRVLARGQRVREALKQPQYAPMPAAEQIAILLAVTSGVLDGVPVERIAGAERAVRRAAAERAPDVCRRIEAGDPLAQDDFDLLLELSRQAARESEAAPAAPAGAGTAGHADA
jgi:F-type H+-transporting ATPase subunit alpha